MFKVSRPKHLQMAYHAMEFVSGSVENLVGKEKILTTCLLSFFHIVIESLLS